MSVLAAKYRQFAANGAIIPPHSRDCLRRHSMRRQSLVRVLAGVVAILAAAAALRAQGSGAASPPDLILSNGKIVTVDERFTIAQAVAVRGERVRRGWHQPGHQPPCRACHSSNRPARADGPPGAHRQPHAPAQVRHHVEVRSPLGRGRDAEGGAGASSHPHRAGQAGRVDLQPRGMGRSSSSRTTRGLLPERSSTPWRRIIRCSCRRPITRRT